MDDLICLEEKESVLVAVVRCTAHSHLQREHGLVCHVSWAPRWRPGAQGNSKTAAFNSMKVVINKKKKKKK